MLPVSMRKSKGSVVTGQNLGFVMGESAISLLLPEEPDQFEDEIPPLDKLASDKLEFLSPTPLPQVNEEDQEAVLTTPNVIVVTPSEPKEAVFTPRPKVIVAS